MNRLTLLSSALVLCVLALLVARPHRHDPPAPPLPALGDATSSASAKPIHSLRDRNVNGASEYLVQNLVAGPIEARCYFADSDNVVGEPALPVHLVVGAREERSVVVMHVVDPRKPSRATVECQAQVGDPGANPGTNFRYALPFAQGTAYTLEQGFDGAYSHNDAENRYALDFGVPEGTPVLAARAGVVMQVEDDFRGGGTDAARYGDRANYVRVLHDDGSMAVYAHLAPGSMLRQPGDRVVVGQMVGKSGNTGYSTGPHLHFSVQRNAGMALVAIPFQMAGVDPRAARH